MNSLEFWSAQREFGLKIPEAQIKEILSICVKSSPNETGGILLGKYTAELNCALITVATQAPSDSHSGRTWFKRGVHGLQSLIKKLWINKREYYLGEWHFHPYAAPIPSNTDIAQVQEIAESGHYQCPEPILLIIGGDPKNKWTAKSFVFIRGQSYQELK